MNKLHELRTLVTIQANDEGKLPTEIEILQAGTWRTPYHGNFEVTPQNLQEYVNNFKNDVRASSSTHGLPIDFEHNTHGGAAGWIKDLEVRGASLWASIEWNKKGAEAVANKEYKFFSPEFQPEEYEDPEQAGVFIDNVLMGGGLTTRPLFKGLTPVTANDSKENDEKVLTPGHVGSTIYLKPVAANNGEPMKLQDLLKKKASDLTKEEQKFIAAHVDELNDDQKKAYDFLEKKSKKANDEEEESEEEEEESEEEEEQEEEEEKDPKQANDGKVTISASELSALRAKADRGVEAAEKLERKEASEHLTEALFASDKPKLPVTAKDSVVDFYLSLDKKQKKAFDGIIEKLPSVKMFSEIGDSEANSKKAADALDKEAEKLMAKDKKLTYSQALKQASEQNPELAKQHVDGEE